MKICGALGFKQWDTVKKAWPDVIKIANFMKNISNTA